MSMPSNEVRGVHGRPGHIGPRTPRAGLGQKIACKARADLACKTPDSCRLVAPQRISQSLVFAQRQFLAYANRSLVAVCRFPSAPAIASIARSLSSTFKRQAGVVTKIERRQTPGVGASHGIAL